MKGRAHNKNFWQQQQQQQISIPSIGNTAMNWYIDTLVIGH